MNSDGHLVQKNRGVGLIVAFGIVAWSVLAPTTASAKDHEGDPEKGKRIFRLCAGCHSLKRGEIRVGPSLAGLFGRMAGSVQGFRYSMALKNAAVVWDENTLDAWLANPRLLVPGNRMPFSGLRKAKHRADNIAFLKEATR